MKGTKDKCLVYKQPSIKEALTTWANADYANDNEDRKSITGYLILAFSNPICWVSKKQLVVAQSTTEAEYIAMNICSKQLRWLTFVWNNLGHAPPQPRSSDHIKTSITQFQYQAYRGKISINS
ncbi:hypothetical protein O181_062372 [Austropuccinia psidii MF-1]|uniref:Uncharacterized protein n=1 Tax=Austropuccinia psidii MF-1 TaxID=1389203 RepID=A0A9Q3I0B3_9BASI|nr:hypothetical protein [Austropuccinia psidii MF-1]